MDIKTKLILRGLATYIPGFPSRAGKGTHGTNSARYCYSVWLRHLIHLHRHGLPAALHTVAEFGPGDSLGTGLAALLSGADRYYAFDVVEHASTETNLAILDELIDLFRRRAPIPGPNEYPNLQPAVDAFDFPAHIISDTVLAKSLAPERLDAIRDALRDTTRRPESGKPIDITYVVPWHDPELLQPGSVDLIFSQAVFEYVDDLPALYTILGSWLKPGGCMSHQIDFSSHTMTREWNGHWAFSDLAWHIANRSTAYRINRQPHSVHLDLARQVGLRLLTDLAHTEPNAIPRRRLASRFRDLSDSDLATRWALIQAAKP